MTTAIFSPEVQPELRPERWLDVFGRPRRGKLTDSVPFPVVAPQLVLDGSVVAQRQPQLAVGQVESEQRDGSAAACVEDQPFQRLGLDVEGKVGPDKDTRQREV